MVLQEELVTYLTDAINQFDKLEIKLQSKNKTLKIKAFINIISLSKARLIATKNYARAGGYQDLSVLTQKSVYTPIIEYIEGNL